MYISQSTTEFGEVIETLKTCTSCNCFILEYSIQQVIFTYSEWFMPRFSGYRSAGLWYSGTDWDPWGEECHKLPVRGPGTAGQTGQRCKTWSTKGNIGGGGWLMRRELVYGTLYFPYSIFHVDIILCLWKKMFWFPTIFLNNRENNSNLKSKCDNHGIFLKFTIKWSL